MKAKKNDNPDDRLSVKLAAEAEACIRCKAGRYGLYKRLKALVGRARKLERENARLRKLAGK